MIHNKLKRTIFTSGGLELLQMVSKLGTERCANEDIKPRMRWIVKSHINWRRERVPAKTLGPEKGWIVRSHIVWRGEQSILYKGVKTSP